MFNTISAENIKRGKGGTRTKWLQETCWDERNECKRIRRWSALVKHVNIKFGKQQEIKTEHLQGWITVVPMQQCTKHVKGTLHAVNHNAELCWRRTAGGKAVLWGRKKEVYITPALKLSFCYKIAPSSYPNSALGNILQQFPTAWLRKSQLNFRGASFNAGGKRWSSDFSTSDVKFHSITNKSVVYST